MAQLIATVIFEGSRSTSFTKEFSTSEEAKATADGLLAAVAAASKTYTITGAGIDRQKQGWISLEHVAAVTTEILE